MIVVSERAREETCGFLAWRSPTAREGTAWCICPCNATIVLDGGGGGGGVGGPAAPDEWEPEEEWLRNYMRNVKMHRG